MTEGLNRTADWPRLREAGFFRVTDSPGQIELRRPLRRIPLFVAIIVLAWVVPLVVTGNLWLAALVGFTPTLLLGPVLFTTVDYATRVVFRPDRISFYGPLGGLGALAREGMQQIAVVEKAPSFVFHRFVADTGAMRAFIGRSPVEAALKNNILMAAFAQPLHLDIEAVPVAYSPPPAAPQLTLRP